MKSPADSFLFFLTSIKCLIKRQRHWKLAGMIDDRAIYCCQKTKSQPTFSTTCVSSTEMDVALLELSEQYKLVQFSVIFFCVLQCLTETVQ